MRFTMRAGRRPDSKRASDPARDTSESTALGHELLQYFVDELQALRARSDATMLMNRARELRAQLVIDGVPETSLPKLIGDAGRHWYKR